MSESEVFVVRVWRTGDAFRATARAVEHEDTQVFSEPLDLLRFLQAGSGTTGDASGRDSLSAALRSPARRNKR